uniref:SH3 domain containing ring finger 3 n=1 Tax=Astyanax mexicanus TaxID=7994 RepID=A0A3B1IGN9_ASTMX
NHKQEKEDFIRPHLSMITLTSLVFTLPHSDCISSPSSGCRYRAEIELKEGDIVFVHKKREDGWYKGTLQRTGRTGLFPGSFVEIHAHTQFSHTLAFVLSSFSEDEKRREEERKRRGRKERGSWNRSCLAYIKAAGVVRA